MQLSQKHKTTKLTKKKQVEKKSMNIFKFFKIVLSLFFFVNFLAIFVVDGLQKAQKYFEY